MKNLFLAAMAPGAAAMRLAVPAAMMVVAPATVAQAPAADESALEAARSLLKQNGFEAQMAATARLVSAAAFDETVKAYSTKQGMEMPADLLAEVKAAIGAEVEILITQLQANGLEDAARVYARYFTAEEIKRFAELQQDPVMKKAQSLTPQLMTELSQIGMKAAAERQPAMQARIAKLLEQWAAKQKPSKTSGS